MSTKLAITPVLESWGLSKSALLPILRHATGNPEIHDFRVEVRHEVSGYKGYCAEKLIPTFCFRTARGEEVEVTLFVKRMGWPGRCESLRYEALQPLGLPLPRYYGFALGAKGEDIVFLEYVRDVGLNPKAPDEARQLIQGVACINATAVPEALQTCGANDKPYQPTGSHDQARIERWQSDVRKIWQLGLAGELGNELLQFGSTHSMASLLFLAEVTGAALSGVPHGLNHNDLNFQNLGWRNARKELVFFDLHKLGLSPRFSDLAAVVQLLSYSSSLSRREIMELYLEEYLRRGGNPVEGERVDREVDGLEKAGAFTILNWFLKRSLDGKVDWTADLEEGRRQNREWMLERLRFLCTRCSDWRIYP